MGVFMVVAVTLNYYIFGRISATRLKKCKVLSSLVITFKNIQPSKYMRICSFK